MNTARIKHVGAIGAGRMGRGIAHVFAYAGYRVTLADVKPRSAREHMDLLAEARAEIAGNLAALAEFGAFDSGFLGVRCDFKVYARQLCNCCSETCQERCAAGQRHSTVDKVA